MKIRSKLLIGCETEEDKKFRKQLLIENKDILNIIKEVVKSDLHLLEANQVATKRYDSVTWAFRQADYNGSKRTLTELLTLLTIEV